jgi:peptide/nickel transport system substrate-binding protein
VDKSNDLIGCLQAGMIGRREFLKRAMALGLTLPAASVLLAACGGGGGGATAAETSGGETAPSGATGAPAETAAGEPTPGGTLIFARNFEPESLDPMGPADNGSIFVRVQIFDTLVRQDPETQPVVGPGIAESWESSADGLEWTFTIRDAKFSNGDPVTVDDVKFTLDRFMDPKINVNIPSLAYGFKSVDIVDEKTIKITLQFPVGALLTNLSVFPASIVNKKLVTEQGDDHWKNPVGTGPFILKEWVAGDHVTLAKNANYWEAGLPYLDEVRFDYVADDNARILRIQSGEADLVEGVPFSQIQSLQGQQGFALEIQTIARWEGIEVNHNKPPLDDINVRKALNLALDKDAINQAVYGAAAEIANDMIPKGQFTADPATVPPYPFDLDQAKQLIAQSPASGGIDVTFIYPAGSSIHKELSTIVQAQWGEIGVKVKLEEVDQASLFDRYLAGDWDLAVPLVQFTADVPVNDEVALLFYDDNPENALRAFATGWKVPHELVQMTQKFAQGTSDDERASLYLDIQKLAMDQAPWVTLFFAPAVTAVGNQVKGFKTLLAAWWDLEDVWLER